MKKIAILVIVALIAGSCSLFNKPAMSQDQIDAMTAQNAKLQEDLVNAQHEASVYKMKADECNKVLIELQKGDKQVASGLYVVVVGSFKNQDFATNFAAKMKQMGAQGAIVDGPSNFKLVTYSSHTSLREAIGSLEKARLNISSEAWVYMKK